MSIIDATALEELLALKDFSEDLHPRDAHGRFASGGGEPAKLPTMSDWQRGQQMKDQLRTALLGSIPPMGMHDPELQLAPLSEREAAKAAIVQARGADLAAAAQGGAVHAEMRGDYPDTEQGRASLETDFLDRQQGDKLPEGMTDEQLYGEMKAQDYVDQWAATAADSDGAAQAMQIATGMELDVPGSTSFHDFLRQSDPGVSEDREAVLETESATMRSFVRSEYDATQSYLRDAGIGPDDPVTLYRGVHYGKDDAPSPFPSDGSYRIETNPASSWTVDRSTALEDFAGNYPDNASAVGYLLTSVVNAQDIISTARTGRGALTEGEVVVRNHDNFVAHVERTAS